MKGKILKFILVISLLLNASVLISAGYAHYKQSRYQSFPPGCEFHKDGGHLFEQLALKPDQLKGFQEKALPFHAAMLKKKEEIDRRRSALVGLMRAGNPDRKEIDVAITQINRMQEELQRMVAAHMLELKVMLDKDQQKKFFDLIEGAMVQQKGM
jgi:Spy/CpxP family protein refolding chaperone